MCANIEDKQFSFSHKAGDRNPIRNDIVLDVYNCDLTMIVKHGCLRGETMVENGLCSLWSGIRATHGMNQGRVAFQIKIARSIRSSNLLPNENPFGIRVGWSTNESGLYLGDEFLSYGYEDTGKFWTKQQTNWYGRRYSVGDTITCYADFESEHGNVLISFSKNNSNFELAYRINYEELHSRALFPHIFIKNIAFQVNFGQLNTEFPLRSGFRFLNDYHQDERIRGTLGPSSKEECEVIMMVGLPGAGKSVWVKRHCAINTDKKYVVLGTNNVINQMKIDDDKGNSEMIDRATQCLQAMFEISVREKRNFIIDQTNVFGRPRRRKMSLFEGFYRRAVVVIPDDAEYQRRRYKEQTEQKKSTPDLLINQMKAHFNLPEVADVFDDVEYAELPFRDARDLIISYRQQDQLTEEPLRNNKRKRKDEQKSQGSKLNYTQHIHHVDLLSDHYSSRSKQKHRYYSSMTSSRRYRPKIRFSALKSKRPWIAHSNLCNGNVTRTTESKQY